MTGTPARRRRHPAVPGDGFDRRLLPPMILGAVLNPVNSSIIAVSLVPIGVAFGAPPSQTAWLVSALYLATAIGQPVVGRLVDLLGPRRLFLTGAAMTGLAGLTGMLAPNLGVLVAARVLLGLGTCAGYPAAMHLIRSEADRTGRDSPAGVLTALAVATQTVAVVGPALGGLLIGLGGWRTTLAVNIPLSAACLLCGARRLPRTPPPPRHGADRPSAAARIDLPGMALFAALLVTLLLFLMDPQAGRLYLPAVSVLAAAGFAARELRTPQPFIDLRVLAGNLPLVATYTRALLAYLVAYGFLFGYTQWLEEGRGLSASQAGLAQLPLFLTGLLVAALTGRRKGVRGKLLAGGAGQVLACTVLLTFGASTPVWMLVAFAVLAGIPQGLNGLALQNSVHHQADPARAGSSAGLLRTFTYLGAMTSSAADGTFLADGATTAGLHHLAWLMLAVGGLFLVVTLADRGLGRVGAAPVGGTRGPGATAGRGEPAVPR